MKTQAADCLIKGCTVGSQVALNTLSFHQPPWLLDWKQFAKGWVEGRGWEVALLALLCQACPNLAAQSLDREPFSSPPRTMQVKCTSVNNAAV